MDTSEEFWTLPGSHEYMTYLGARFCYMPQLLWQTRRIFPTCVFPLCMHLSGVFVCVRVCVKNAALNKYGEFHIHNYTYTECFASQLAEPLIESHHQGLKKGKAFDDIKERVNLDELDTIRSEY